MTKSNLNISVSFKNVYCTNFCPYMYIDTEIMQYWQCIWFNWKNHWNYRKILALCSPDWGVLYYMLDISSPDCSNLKQRLQIQFLKVYQWYFQFEILSLPLFITWCYYSCFNVKWENSVFTMNTIVRWSCCTW